MKLTKKLDIENKTDYFFNNMTNINDFDPRLLSINEITVFNSGSTFCGIHYCEKSNTPYIIFNNVKCIFRKNGENKYLIICESRKNKEMLKSYTKIFDEIKKQIMFITGDEVFVMGKSLTRFKIKTNNVLPYNEIINVSVCVIVIKGIFEENYP